MWGNGQPKDYFDPDWSSPGPRRKFPWKLVAFVAAALLIIYVFWS